MVAHVEKHAERLETVLVKDKSIPPDAPTFRPSIKQWVADASKASSWTDAVGLKAVAEWDNGIVKPRFTGGYAMGARDAKPICLMLEAGRSLSPSSSPQGCRIS